MNHFTPNLPPRLRIAVIGSGISGLSAAWLLAQAHDVTVFEADGRIGGHSNSVDVAGVATPVDTGFIVYNEVTYPNLTALFAHLGVASHETDMSFGVSIDGGRLEYAGAPNPLALFAQKRNLLRPRFYDMLIDLMRFYREAPREAETLGLMTLDAYLDLRGYGQAIRQDHLYPMAAAIWSTPAGQVGVYPAKSFIRFCQNHGLLQTTNRPMWRTVIGGSRAYVEKLTAAYGTHIHTQCGARQIVRVATGVDVVDAEGQRHAFDRVVLACHADEALRLIDQPTPEERSILGAFAYSNNTAILHSDAAQMPKRKGAWCAWNYLANSSEPNGLTVTYWMNKLQGFISPEPMFVTLNPLRRPPDASIHYETQYTHPLFDADAIAAQPKLWSLQGHGGVWFAGAYFGAGFHEDGLQAGLAVAEMLGGVARPWVVANPSGRVNLPEGFKIEVPAARRA